VDSIFSPVRRVAFQVEPTRVEQSTNYDRLVLDIILPEGGRQLLVIDLTNGARLGIVELRTIP